VQRQHVRRQHVQQQHVQQQHATATQSNFWPDGRFFSIFALGVLPNFSPFGQFGFTQKFGFSFRSFSLHFVGHYVRGLGIE